MAKIRTDRDWITEQIEQIVLCVREGREAEATRLEKRLEQATRSKQHRLELR